MPSLQTSRIGRGFLAMAPPDSVVSRAPCAAKVPPECPDHLICPVNPCATCRPQLTSPLYGRAYQHFPRRGQRYVVHVLSNFVASSTYLTQGDQGIPAQDAVRVRLGCSAHKRSAGEKCRGADTSGAVRGLARFCLPARSLTASFAGQCLISTTPVSTLSSAITERRTKRSAISNLPTPCRATQLRGGA